MAVTLNPFGACFCGQPRGSYCRRKDCPTKAHGMKLSPCPFCGGDDIDVVIEIMQARQAHQAAALCQTCGAQGPVLTFEQPGQFRIAQSLMYDSAAGAWNARTATPPATLPPPPEPQPAEPEPEPAVEEDEDYWR